MSELTKKAGGTVNVNEPRVSDRGLLEKGATGRYPYQCGSETLDCISK